MRVLLFSLCLGFAAHAASIEPTTDPWSVLRTAPPPEVSPEPDYPVPDLTLDLGPLLQFVMDWAYLSIDDPMEYSAILSALLPQYEALLAGRTAATPAASPMAAALSLTAGLDVQHAGLDPSVGGGSLKLLALSSAPEPGTWLTVALGLVGLAGYRGCRRS